ncbi:MAG: sulfatase [Verrucomicrobiales bacterium]|nr:sulfatase [Verrucomicrobiales bacterium]
MIHRLLLFLLLPWLCAAQPRPNILLCIADDASWHHFGANGDKACHTPVFDRVAREGVNFRHAFCSSPSCTPSRGALLTGQQFWRLEDGANLWSRWPNKAAVYPDLLAAAGYHVGLKGKGWGPGDARFSGRKFNPAGPGVKDFATFLQNKPADKPFCFWFGSQDPHRMYERGSGVKSGMKIEDVQVPPYLPDTPAVRSDILDYCLEVQRFDRDIGAMLKLLEDTGQLDRTLVVITSDNGWPFPRGKATCYDAGTRMPLAVRWPERIPGGRTVDDFVSLTDLAPTFLEAAGLPMPPAMTGKSLLPLLTSGKSGQVEPERDKAIFGRERHANVRAGNLSYPVRAIRTADFLYLRNGEPDRWPAGDPPIYGDVDQHLNISDSPAKQAVVQHDHSAAAKRLFDLAFAKRPAEELYDLRADPYQMQNVAGDVRFADTRKKLRAALDAYLIAAKDPRAAGQGGLFDHYPYVTGDAGPR